MTLAVVLADSRSVCGLREHYFTLCGVEADGKDKSHQPHDTGGSIEETRAFLNECSALLYKTNLFSGPVHHLTHSVPYAVRRLLVGPYTLPPDRINC